MRWWILYLHFAFPKYRKADGYIDFAKYYAELTPYKSLYMDVLYYMKNKDTVDSLTWEDLCALWHLISTRELGGGGK